MVDNGYEQDIRACLEVLENGGIILYPTDTVWGLGCDALNEAAINKLFMIKDRPKNKSMIVLVADAREILQYVAITPPDIIAIIGSFDRPTTVVYENPLDFPDNLRSEDGSVAMRVTTDEFCKALIKRYKKPIVSTSANLSGEETPAVFAKINPLLIGRADYVVSWRQDDNKIVAPSRVIKLDEDGGIEVLRK